MKKNDVRMLIATVIGLHAVALAGPAHDRKPYTGSMEFERVKSLAGYWEATVPDMADSTKTSTLSIDYRVTSGGSAVVETWGSGTPHEMVTVYADVNGKVAATHYCMLANQPHMTLKKSTPTQIFLEVADDDKRIDLKSQHMRSLMLDVSTPNKLTQTWVSYMNGKAEPATVFTFVRIKK